MPKSQTKGIDPKHSKVVSAIEPSTEAINDNNSIGPRRIWWRELRRTAFSTEPQTYIVRIEGTRRNYVGAVSEVAEQTAISAYHPYMAVGEAVCSFVQDGGLSTIQEITVSRLVPRKPANTK